MLGIPVGAKPTEASQIQRPDISGVIEREAAGNLKRTWVNNGMARDWMDGDIRDFLNAATEVKTVWVPYGE